jgi:excisionase family DNA binding protein
MPTETIDAILNQLERIENNLITRHSPWYSVKEACDYLRCQQSHLYQLMKAGKLKYTRLSDGKTKGKMIFHKHWLTAAAMGYGRKLSPVQRREVDDLEY